ncbi:MAG: hypothetical protein JNL74_14550, partial [Fibrobacteres bacterium]|nr:hypothetical protein [Fibrobacterota bacterium]
TGDTIISIHGTIDDNTAIIICNNDTLLPPHSGNFTFSRIKLASGINSFRITARDAAHNYATPILFSVTKTDGSLIYIDNTHTGSSDGSIRHPYKTLAEGVSASAINGTIIIKSGTYNEGTAFKQGQKIQSEKGGVLLNCGTSPYYVVGSISFDRINFTGDDKILDIRNGNSFSMVSCTLFIKKDGITINSCRSINITDFKVSKNKLSIQSNGKALSFSSCDTVRISFGRVDSCGDAGIAISGAKHFYIKNVLFNGLRSEGLQTTLSSGKVGYSTFVNNLNGINTVKSSIDIENTLFSNCEAYAIYDSAGTFKAKFNLFYKNDISNSNSPDGIDSSSSLFVDPLFESNTDYFLAENSPAKTASATGGEIGWRGTSFSGKRGAAPSIISPITGYAINRAIPLRFSTDKLNSDLSLLKITSNGKTLTPTASTTDDNNNVWCYLPINSTDINSICCITFGNTYYICQHTLPKLEFESDSISVFSRFYKDQSPSELKITTDNGWVSSINKFKDTLFTLATSPVLTYSDSFFINNIGQAFRLWRYRFNLESETNNILDNNTNNKIAQIKDLHFVPSPYKPHIRKNGIIRYRLSKDIDVQITIYDRIGSTIKTYSFISGVIGATSGVNEISWDGKNESGLDVSSGVYIAEVKTTDKQSIARVKFILSRAK